MILMVFWYVQSVDVSRTLPGHKIDCFKKHATDIAGKVQTIYNVGIPHYFTPSKNVSYDVPLMSDVIVADVLVAYNKYAQMSFRVVCDGYTIKLESKTPEKDWELDQIVNYDEHCARDFEKDMPQDGTQWMQLFNSRDVEVYTYETIADFTSIDIDGYRRFVLNFENIGKFNTIDVLNLFRTVKSKRYLQDASSKEFAWNYVYKSDYTTSGAFYNNLKSFNHDDEWGMNMNGSWNGTDGAWKRSDKHHSDLRKTYDDIRTGAYEIVFGAYKEGTDIVYGVPIRQITSALMNLKYKDLYVVELGTIKKGTDLQIKLKNGSQYEYLQPIENVPVTVKEKMKNEREYAKNYSLNIDEYTLRFKIVKTSYGKHLGGKFNVEEDTDDLIANKVYYDYAKTVAREFSEESARKGKVNWKGETPFMMYASEAKVKNGSSLSGINAAYSSFTAFGEVDEDFMTVFGEESDWVHGQVGLLEEINESKYIVVALYDPEGDNSMNKWYKIMQNLQLKVEGVLDVKTKIKEEIQEKNEIKTHVGFSLTGGTIKNYKKIDVSQCTGGNLDVLDNLLEHKDVVYVYSYSDVNDNKWNDCISKETYIDYEKMDPLFGATGRNFSEIKDLLKKRQFIDGDQLYRKFYPYVEKEAEKHINNLKDLLDNDYTKLIVMYTDTSKTVNLDGSLKTYTSSVSVKVIEKDTRKELKDTHHELGVLEFINFEQVSIRFGTAKQWFDRKDYNVATSFEELINTGTKKGFWKYTLSTQKVTKGEIFGMYKTSKYFATETIKNEFQDYVWKGEAPDLSEVPSADSVATFYSKSTKQSELFEKEWYDNLKKKDDKKYTLSEFQDHLQKQTFIIDFYVYKTNDNVVFGPTIRLTGSGLFPIKTVNGNDVLREIADFTLADQEITFKNNKKIGDKYFNQHFKDEEKYHRFVTVGETPKGSYDSERDNSYAETICYEVHEELWRIKDYFTPILAGGIGGAEIGYGSSLIGALAKYHGYSVLFQLSNEGIDKKFEQLKILDDDNNIIKLYAIVIRDLAYNDKYKLFALIPTGEEEENLTKLSKTISQAINSKKNNEILKKFFNAQIVKMAYESNKALEEYNGTPKNVLEDRLSKEIVRISKNN
jgi:hypothetical protein